MYRKNDHYNSLVLKGSEFLSKQSITKNHNKEEFNLEEAICEFLQYYY